MPLRRAFSNESRWIVGSGTQIDFWDDNWVFLYPISKKIPCPTHHSNIKVKDVMLDNNGWNVPLLNSFLPTSIVSYNTGIYIQYILF